ncbi:uncharacterized protein [Bemisia tabaci]|uniref:uncharacterized protein isoform X3 n=1 Tax=Bemisia tabaci TaxID=7038 RepID=UPI003B28C3A2
MRWRIACDQLERHCSAAESRRAGRAKYFINSRRSFNPRANENQGEAMGSAKEPKFRVDLYRSISSIRDEDLTAGPTKIKKKPWEVRRNRNSEWIFKCRKELVCLHVVML